MDLKFVLILCIALILAANPQVDGDALVVSSSIADSNSTDRRFSIGSEISVTSTNVTDSKRNNNTSGDGSKIEGNSSKIASDESESESTKKEEGVRKKEGSHGEECDPSNMCTDEEDQFVACLRVPGNDAPHLSLLIQNKGKNVVVVTINAPGFVKLDKDKVQLLANEDTKVTVSIRKGGSNDSAIILTSTKGQCKLELKDLAAAHETGNDDPVAVSRPSVLNIRTRTLIMISMISFLVISLVVIPVIIHFYKKKSQGNNKYQRLDMELPVSSPAAMVSKSEQETGDDGWNNNWGDDWDDENGGGDEEQPNTPVLPLTPSVSSRGLAPRRLSKEGWKD